MTHANPIGDIKEDIKRWLAIHFGIGSMPLISVVTSSIMSSIGVAYIISELTMGVMFVFVALVAVALADYGEVYYKLHKKESLHTFCLIMSIIACIGTFAACTWIHYAITVGAPSPTLSLIIMALSTSAFSLCFGSFLRYITLEEKSKCEEEQ